MRESESGFHRHTPMVIISFVYATISLFIIVAGLSFRSMLFYPFHLFSHASSSSQKHISFVFIVVISLIAGSGRYTWGDEAGCCISGRWLIQEEVAFNCVSRLGRRTLILWAYSYLGGISEKMEWIQQKF
ncbi:hypothetical protein BJ508DRAFT_182621 [Ascobolus immersus RN42]|uniref:Uncharacterized protein n=1 Tax=Ascobolus immersus RN42 TaxID=1160509 RepID=A0A3N4HXD0_ASCIM|nr:hypothetical protein BJ508DRAFT_182621 [Ascobolus immersus RN42]